MNNEEKDSKSDVFNLILKLRQEKIYVTNEKNKIQELNASVRSKTQKVIKKSWITTKQRLLDNRRESCLQNLKQLDVIMNSNFMEAKKRLGFQNSVKIGKILQTLRAEPEELARLLFLGEHLTENYHRVLQTLVNGLYACFLFSEDKKHILTLLYELAKLQLAQIEEPRSILKQGNCSFRNLYLLFNEVSHQAKFFLSASLETPIVELLCNSSNYLDLDPDKSLMRFKQDIQNNHKDFEEYREEIVNKLVELTNCFVSSLLENVYAFPKCIAWIVYQVSKIIEKSFGLRESNAMITELIFTLYICPVIVDPEQYGVCTLEVTEIARHNLMQVGQLLQNLALYKHQKPETKEVSVFTRLDKKGILEFLDLLFFEVDNIKEPPVESAPMLIRDILLFTESELYVLVSFLQRVMHENRNNNDIDKTPLRKLSLEEQLANLSIHVPIDPPRVQRSTSADDSGSNRSKFFTVKNSPRNIEEVRTNVVLIFSIEGVDCEPIGLLPEEKICENIKENDNILYKNVAEEIVDNTNANGDIKPSYANLADEGSIGNTSDNLEAISEAASNHSVASSLELENEDQNDNLSDMVSANVSGRGSPNISGRDTPSSQVNEIEDRVEARPADAAPATGQLTRQIRSEIDDKFCKFEIKKLLEGDETISIISETWSTDVLASDNETIDANESRLERQNFQLVDQAIHEVPVENILDISETQSESAWSTDVTASDTERLIEIDNDDAGSVAQSDDTNSVARSDDTRSETDENVAGLRRLSSSSNSYSNNPTPVYAANTLQEYRKETKNERVNGKIYHSEQVKVDTNANNVLFKSDTQQAHNSVTFSENKREIKTTYNSRTSTLTTVVNNRVVAVNGKDADPSALAGPSGINKHRDSVDSPLSFLKQNHKKYEDANEILLSNCSLNSSSSGSSSNSFENKNSHNETENSERWENKQWLNSSGSSLNVTLTPSESTSELSVLSVNNINNPSNILNKKSATLLLQRGFKPSISTGAIPKSISFDTSADKGLDDDQKKRGSIFGKIRMGFKNKRGKCNRNDDGRLESEEYSAIKRLPPASPIKNNTINTDSSDDILAKYRNNKPFNESSPIKQNSSAKSSSSRAVVDRNSGINGFNDVKKKLRLALCNTSEIPYHVKNSWISAKGKIDTILKIELGKARTLREYSNAARISEAIRCVSTLDNETCVKLLESMRQDVLQRSNYVNYLVASTQELLFCDKYLNSLMEQISNERAECERYLGNRCVNDFLRQKEDLILSFCEEFVQLTLADEKYDLLHQFYDRLYSIMEESNWGDILKHKEALIKSILERSIMNKVYTHSIYPNGDGDRDRDSLLYEHIKKLSRTISPEHKDLMISKEYLREYPWQPAQDALKALNATRTPRDIVNCILHCAKCIMDLLSFSQNAGSATADDFTPVLVYVIIKVNPKALLSTVQFVNSFYSNQLLGEEDYWWTQFSSAVEFIKTMDYSD
ncbi:unnamed protein product [Brassicogethes aeneus]|uniref:Receptor-mediated endocytosis protein 6 homolog n=1 Tax=Brassicogethes aeneus TaxID=1431903 RepID=A0A9P0FF42_BRAAE|nr:unnamed protein product [Brassicogethes aeneus]